MYITKSGDMWDMIAKSVYGDEIYADKLMQANPNKIETFVFSAGEVLNTPELDEDEDGTLPPWKFDVEADDE